MNDQNQSSENHPQEKKQWVTPKVEVITRDIIQIGSIASYPEAVPTVFGGTGSAASF